MNNSKIKMVGKTNESERKKWLEKTLQKIPAGSRILDAGAGTLQHKQYCSHLNYVSQDFAQYNGEGDSKGLQTGEFNYGKLDIVSDITSIPENDGSFDALMCIEVLEHLPNPIEAIREFSRLLRSGGQLVLTAPFCSLTHFAPYHFSSGFNHYWYEEHLQKFGFEVMEITPNGNFFEYLAQEVRRIPSVAEKFTDTEVGFFDRLAIRWMRSVLGRLSQKDRNSSELLCHGYHVSAVKK